MIVLHRYVAFLIPAGWAILAGWAAVMLIRNKAPGVRFWTLLGIMQVALAIEIVLGAVLLVGALVAGSGYPPLLHYAYGALFPIFLLMLAHQWGRKHGDISFIGFGVAALLIAGLTTRALMTGLGIG